MDILFIRHTNFHGGAKIFSNLLEKELKTSFSVNSNNQFDLLCQKFVIPFYVGIKFHVFGYYLLKSFLSIFSFPKLLKEISKYDRVLFSSSIFFILAIFISKIFPNKYVFLVIQENLNIRSNFFNFLLKLSSNIKFINISDNLNNYILNKRIQAFYIPNYIDLDNSDIESNESEYDLLYSGGDLNIKGFSNFLKILNSLNDIGDKVNIALIGHYSEANKQLIHNNCPKNVSIKNFGLVKNSLSYINKSYLVIIPIGKPHFCRMAIEAGLLEKTFIIDVESKNLEFVAKENCFIIDKWENFANFYSGLKKINISTKSKNNFIFSSNWNNNAEIQLSKVTTYFK